MHCFKLSASTLFLISSDSPICQEIAAESAAFHKAVEGWRKEKEKATKDGTEAPPAWGPPGPILGRALVEHMMGSDCGALNKNALKAWAEETEDQPETFADQFPICRLEPTASEQTMRLQLAVHHPQGRLALRAGLVQLSARQCKGAAPPGHMEDEISDWISYLESKK